MQAAFLPTHHPPLFGFQGAGDIWPVGQAVKTEASHASNVGSIPARVTIVGVFNGEGPPVPIPNTEVKLTSADDTCLATGRKNRSMPTQSPRGEILGGFLCFVREFKTDGSQRKKYSVNTTERKTAGREISDHLRAAALHNTREMNPTPIPVVME